MPRSSEAFCCSRITDHNVAGGLGFEPRLAESESDVLPLDDQPNLGTGLYINYLHTRNQLVQRRNVTDDITDN